MNKIYIPNSIALRNFDTIFSKNNFDFSHRILQIEFHPTYVAMHPVGLAFYAAMADACAEKNCEIKAKMKNNIRSIPFLQRMGLFRSLGFYDPIQTKVHDETGRFIPLTKIKTGIELENFIKTIDPILHTTRENSRAIKHVFSELIRNVLEHAEATHGANVCASYNRKKKKISIGIADAGKGIRSSLARYHDVPSDKEALIKAITPGITGSTKRIGGNEQNAGAGLFFTKSIAKATRNHFLVYSGSSYFKLLITPQSGEIEFDPNPLKDYGKFKENLPYFKGTVVGIDIQIDNQKAFNNLIENIGKAYQLGIRKNQKDYYKRINFS